MRIGSGKMIALQTFSQTLSRIPFAYKRASLPFRGTPLCPLCGHVDFTHMKFYSAQSGFAATGA
jgi:hypothetical protein